jgi:hypothetical protein
LQVLAEFLCCYEATDDERYDNRDIHDGIHSLISLSYENEKLILLPCIDDK